MSFTEISTSLPALSAEAFHQNINEAEQAISTTTRTHPTLLRPPYGALSPVMRGVLTRDGYRTVSWNIDPEDWNKDSTSDQIVQHIVSAAKPNAIILMYDDRDTHIDYPRDNTIGALPRVIEELRARGYLFVTLDALIS